jgi:hypothetical protein
MFLRKNRKRFDGEIYEYWTLCETVRTERGPRQRVVASLGKFTEEDLAGGWEDIEALLEGRRPVPKQRQLFDQEREEEPTAGWELADLHNLGVERVWRSLEMGMQSKGLGSSARKLAAAFSTIRSMDVTVPVKGADSTISLRLRTVAKPDPDVALLLAHLGLHLPKGSKLVQNVVEKIA